VSGVSWVRDDKFELVACLSRDRINPSTFDVDGFLGLPKVEWRMNLEYGFGQVNSFETSILANSTS